MEKFSSWLNMVAAVLLTICVAIAFFNVVLRYVFRSPFAWGEEVTLLLLVGFVYLPQMKLQLNAEQLMLTVINSKRLVGILDVVTSIFTVILLGPLVQAAWKTITFNYKVKTVTNVLGLPMWLIYIIPGAMLIFMIMATAIRVICGWRQA